jgi:hypothetical protein
MSIGFQALASAFDVSKRRKKDILDPDGNVVLMIYWSPLTLAQQRAAAESAEKAKTNDAGLRLLIQKLEDVDGTKLFDIGDLPRFKQDLPAEVIEQMLDAVLNNQGEVLEPAAVKSTTGK